MGDYASAVDPAAMTMLHEGNAGPATVAERRARLMVQCARDLLGERAPQTGDLHLPLSVTEFERELRERYGSMHPELVFRTESTLERARLERRQLPHIPKVILRQGAPRRVGRAS